MTDDKNDSHPVSPTIIRLLDQPAIAINLCEWETIVEDSKEGFFMAVLGRSREPSLFQPFEHIVFSRHALSDRPYFPEGFFLYKADGEDIFRAIDGLASYIQTKHDNHRVGAVAESIKREYPSVEI